MSIVIREYLDHEGIFVDANYQISEGANGQFNIAESADDFVSPDSLMVDIEGIHVGPTRNFTWYMEEALKGSIPSWTKPYKRPLIYHHNEKDGKTIGRVRLVEYTDKNTKSGTGALQFTVDVPDKDGQEQIKDGRLNTVSIGAIVHDCRCSICGANMAEMSKDEIMQHEHQRGHTYGGKICYWLIYRMEAKELSYVIVPSDIYAQNLRYYKPTAAKSKFSVAANLDNEGVLSVSEASKLDSQGNPIVEGAEIHEDGNNPNPIVSTPDSTAIQKELDEAKAKIKELQDKAEKLEKENETLIADKQKATTEINDAKVLLDQTKKALTDAQTALTVKESALTNEKSLRESLEEQLIQKDVSIKNGIVESVTLLRKALNKPEIAKEELEKRATESLQDAMFDLKEEFSKASSVTSITPVENPSISENHEDNPAGSVKETKNAGNIDLKEELGNLFSSIVSSQVRY